MADGVLNTCGHKLTDEEQHQVCVWYAQFYTPTEITRLIKEKFGKTIAINNIWQYARTNKWRPLIERLRQEWALGVMDLPLAHKRGRLEKLVTLLERSERNQVIDEYRRIEQCVEILHEIRAEMEAGKTQFTNVYLTTIHNYTDEELLRRRDEVLERIKRLGDTHALRHVRQAALTDGTSNGGRGEPLAEGDSAGIEAAEVALGSDAQEGEGVCGRGTAGDTSGRPPTDPTPSEGQPDFGPA